MVEVLIILAPVIQRLNNAIHRINPYTMDECKQNKPRYLLDSYLSVVSVIHLLNNPGLDWMFVLVSTTTMIPCRCIP